ncbi:MAG: hypothetical protein A2017_02840 [Lentisphaerae bacterium GWF2_44_16]|nr:MAG: hypothetical protein A2017_02840 [Lentisphaerae bacterium GWF2_44_16]
MKKYFSGKTLKFWYFKMVRQSGTPEKIARGVAVGLFVGFMIPFGFQLIVAIPLAILFKANKFFSVTGTFVTNHFTIPFIYPFQCYLGSCLLLSPLSLKLLTGQFKSLLRDPSFEALFELGHDVVIPFFAGGAFLAVIFAAAGYFAALGIVIQYRRKKSNRLRKALASINTEQEK